MRDADLFFLAYLAVCLAVVLVSDFIASRSRE